MHSNYTLRFPRTSREAFGHDCSFNDHRPDPERIVGASLLILFIFLAGVLVGAT